MPRSWTDKEIGEAFNRIWPTWINKDMPNAALKALGTFLKQGGEFDTIKLACDIYVEDHRGTDPQYTAQLKNFIYEDLWKDSLEGAKNPEKYLEWQLARRNEAREIVETWNSYAKPHWCKVEDLDSRAQIAKKALQNESFKNNWKKALDKLAKIFQYKPREGTQFSKLIITFQWFCNVSPNKHTVLNIMEGHYGAEPVETATLKRPASPKKITAEEREELFSDWEEVFGRPITRKKNELQSGSIESSAESCEHPDNSGRTSLYD